MDAVAQEVVEDAAEETTTPATEQQLRSTKDFVLPSTTMCLIMLRKELQIKCELHGKILFTTLVQSTDTT